MMNGTNLFQSSASSRPFRPIRRQRGFTLVELMIVIGIAAALMVLATMSLTGVSESRNVDAAARSTALMIQRAQTMALSQKLYVWVGFGSINKDGADSTVVAVFSDPRGVSDAPSAATSKDFRLVAPITTLQGVVLAESGPDAESNILDYTGKFGEFKTEVDKVPVTMTYLMRFGPSGDMQVAPSTVPRALETVLASHLIEKRADKQGSKAVVTTRGISGTPEYAWAGERL